MFNLITKESLQLQSVAACCEQFLVLYTYLVSPLFSQLSRLNQIKGNTNRKFLVHYAPSSLSYKVFTLSQTLQRAVSRTIDPATDISAIKSLQSHYDTERAPYRYNPRTLEISICPMIRSPALRTWLLPTIPRKPWLRFCRDSMQIIVRCCYTSRRRDD